MEMIRVWFSTGPIIDGGNQTEETSEESINRKSERGQPAPDHFESHLPLQTVLRLLRWPPLRISWVMNVGLINDF